MLISRRTELYLLLQSLLLILLYIIYMVGGYKTFNVWSQIDGMIGLNPFLNLDHPHGLRYLLTSPVLFLSEYFDWNRDALFGLFVTFNMAMCAVIAALIQARISYTVEKRWHIWLYLFIPVFLTLSFPMNGRLSYMLLGSAAMMLAYVRWLQIILDKKSLWKAFPYILLYALSLVFLSVSSGCFTVGMLAALAQSFVFVALPTNKTTKTACIIFNIIPPLLLTMLQYTMIEKNLGFYDHSVFAMLTHGPGQFLSVLNPSSYAVGSLFAAIAFVLILFSEHAVFFIRRNILLINPLLLVLFSFLVGLFGYSAMLTGSIAALIIGLHAGGILFSGQQPPTTILRQYMADNIMPGHFSLPYKLAAVTGSAAVALLSFWILPDDWTVYSKAKVEQQLRIDIVYNTDTDIDVLDAHGKVIPMDEMERKKPVLSPIRGNFIPRSVAKDEQGNIFVAENNTRIMRLNSSGGIEVYAGDIIPGDRNGERARSRFRNIVDMATDKHGNLYVVDGGSRKVKKIDAAGKVSTLIGSGDMGIFWDECWALKCNLNDPRAILVMPDNEFIISDNAQLIRLRDDGRARVMVTIGDTTKRQRISEDTK